MRRRRRLCALLSVLGCAIVGSAGASPRVEAREGGIFRVSYWEPTFDYVDPALAYSSSWYVLDTTCARLMTYPDKAPPEGLRLVPEVATDYPRISRNGKTYTFTLRKGFRFSDGTPVRASAFARAINRTLAPGVRSPGAQHTRDIAGAADVQAGKTTTAAGVVARGNTLVVRFTRPVLDFAAKTTMPFFCAVPPTLPSDSEGVRTFPAAGPYYVKEYRPGERVVLRRNRFYGGSRPHHVDGFDVDLTATSHQETLERVERGQADWGPAAAPVYFEPGRRLAEKYGVNKARFYVKPGFTMRNVIFNVSRPLFRDNPRLRRAVNFALDRRALVRVATNSPLSERPTDQYVPPSLPGFKDAAVYPLERPDLRRARGLAQGNTRGGKATLYIIDFPPPAAVAQAVARQLAAIGLVVEVKPIPGSAFFSRLNALDEPWDLTITLWAPDFFDPYTYLNTLFDSRSAANVGRFSSPTYDRLLRKAARLRGPERYRAYGELDVRLARDAAPAAATSYFNEPTLVSNRVGCIVLRPLLDLTAACLK